MEDKKKNHFLCTFLCLSTEKANKQSSSKFIKTSKESSWGFVLHFLKLLNYHKPKTIKLKIIFSEAAGNSETGTSVCFSEKRKSWEYHQSSLHGALRFLWLRPAKHWHCPISSWRYLTSCTENQSLWTTKVWRDNTQCPRSVWRTKIPARTSLPGCSQRESRGEKVRSYVMKIKTISISKRKQRHN